MKMCNVWFRIQSGQNLPKTIRGPGEDSWKYTCYNQTQISCKTKLWYIDKFWQKFSFFSSLTRQCWEGSCNRPAPWLPTYIKACKSFSFHLNTFMTYIYPRRLQMRDICHVVSMQKGSISPQSPFRWGK